MKTGYQDQSPKGIKRMWNLLFSGHLKAKVVMETKSGVTAFKNSPCVTTIADAMKTCEIEANLDEMVLESHDPNILSRYNILKNSVEGRKSLKVYVNHHLIIALQRS